MIPVTNKAYKLLHDGALALSQVEANGIRVDEKYLDRAIKKTSRQIQQLTEQIKTDEIFKVWKKRFGVKTNLGSREQLGKVLFETMKLTCHSRTKTGRPKADEGALEQVNLKFVRRYLRIEKLKKAKNTYLLGIRREVTNGYIHPMFSLHIAATFRSSSEAPNFQNIPIKDDVISELIRRCFISRFKGHIVEADYGGVEVHGAAWYHKDPVMLRYLADETKDLHRDMAQACYLIPKPKIVTKDMRYCGKNRFVFPQFYGDWYCNCAKNLWKGIDDFNLQIKEMPLKKWLKKKGIKRLGACDPDKTPLRGSFEYHIKEVEYDFWNKRFKVYNQWKRDWYEEYQQTGQFTTLTGFTIIGFLKRNEVINYPIQGVAFHCLLWSLIRVQKLLNKYKMKSLIIGQIHDSIVGDVPHKELKAYAEILRQVMTIDIKKHWKWIITNLEIDIEAAPVGKSWHHKKEIAI